jgi:hypothetical protein
MRSKGQLFRRVVEEAVDRGGLPRAVWRERDLYEAASGILKRPEQALRVTLAALGRNTEGSWRAEQKAAALAAWLALVRRPGRAR